MIQRKLFKMPMLFTLMSGHQWGKKRKRLKEVFKKLEPAVREAATAALGATIKGSTVRGEACRYDVYES